MIDKEVRPNKRRIVIDKNLGGNIEEGIFMDRLSEAVEFEFIAMINKITNNQIFEEMMKNIKEIFINMSPTHKTFRNSLFSLKS